MRLRNVLFLAAVSSLLASACGDNNAEPSIQEIKVEPGSNADIIRSPISAKKPLDTMNLAKMDFEGAIFDFGTVVEGTKVAHTFRFKNSGKTALVIYAARSTCGCTIPTYPKEPIPPGESSQIEVKFDTEKKIDLQNKPVTITANTYPSETVIQLKGIVKTNKDK